MKTILVPLDFSEVSDAIVREAALLARAVDARIVLLTVMQSPALTAEYMPAIGNISEITAAAERYAAGQFAKYAERLTAESIKAESLSLYGGPIEHIVEQASELGADYIVMGSHGHTALFDLLVGSTTHGVLRRVGCPVVIVPAGKLSDATSDKEEELSTV